jgi:hypothetical protein
VGWWRQVQDQVKQAKDDGFKDIKLDQHRKEVIGRLQQDLGESVTDQDSDLFQNALRHYNTFQQVHGDDVVKRIPELEELAFLRAWKGTEFTRVQDQLKLLQQEKERQVQQSQMEQGLVGGADQIAARKEALGKGDVLSAIKNLGVVSTLRGG